MIADISTYRATRAQELGLEVQGSSGYNHSALLVLNYHDVRASSRLEPMEPLNKRRLLDAADHRQLLQHLQEACGVPIVEPMRTDRCAIDRSINRQISPSIRNLCDSPWLGEVSRESARQRVASTEATSRH